MFDNWQAVLLLLFCAIGLAFGLCLFIAGIRGILFPHRPAKSNDNDFFQRWLDGWAAAVQSGRSKPPRENGSSAGK
jgi:hypothetical protein